MMLADLLTEIFDQTPSRIAATILAVLVLQLIIRESIGHVVRRLVKSSKPESQIEERKREDTLVRIFRTANAAILWVIAGIIILSELHINIGALATGAGLVGIIVGFGAQNVIKDYLAGMFIIVENQYRVGDVITLNGLGSTNGVSGVVEDISIRITKLRDLDGNLHFVPNGLAGVITNRTFQYANVNVDLNVALDADIDRIEKIVNDTGKTLATDEKWRDSTIEPIRFLRLDRFNEASITVKCLGKVHPGAQWDIAADFRRSIKKAFDDKEIKMPLPQVVVHRAAEK